MIFADNFIFKTFDEAMNVHKQLFRILRIKGCVSYADLYCAMHEEDETPNIEYYDYGWDNLVCARIEHSDKYVNGKWLLKMPKIKRIID